MQISLRIKKYSLFLGVLFGGQQIQGMDLFFQAASTIGEGALTVAQSTPFLFGVMPDAFNAYVLRSVLVENSLGKVPGVNKMIYRINDKDNEIVSSRLSFETSALKIIYKENLGFVEARKKKFTQSTIATLFYIARILGAGYGLAQIIRKDDDKMMGKKGLCLTAGLLIEIKLLGQLLG